MAQNSPTSVTWLNFVERLFAEITIKRIRCGAFSGIVDLEEASEGVGTSDRTSVPVLLGCEKRPWKRND